MESYFKSYKIKNQNLPKHYLDKKDFFVNQLKVVLVYQTNDL